MKVEPIQRGGNPHEHLQPPVHRRRDVFDAPSHPVEDLTGDYAIDTTHTRLGFSARHAMVTTVRGGFTDFDGTATHRHRRPEQVLREHSPSTRPRVDTGVVDRDGHLKSGRLLRRRELPADHLLLDLRSSATARSGAITGDLTIKDVTKPVTIEFEETGSAKDPFGNTRVGFEGATAISRKEWGLTWNAALETGGVLVSDKVKLEFDVSRRQEGLTDQPARRISRPRPAPRNPGARRAGPAVQYAP